MDTQYTAAARRPTPESRIWQKDLKSQKKHAKDGLRELRALVKKDLTKSYAEIKKKHPKRSKADIKKRGLLTLRAVAGHPKIPEMLSRYLGADLSDTKIESRKRSVISEVRHLLTGKKAARDVWKAVDKTLTKGYETVTMEREQAALKQAIPDPLRAFLPKKLTVQVDGSGNIQKMTDRFVNQFETFAVKRQRQKTLLKRFNKIVKTVQKDLKSKDPITRMQATITAIVMETGIRPGQRGNAIELEIDGEDIFVDTFGAVTLQMSHVKVVRDNFAHIEFMGKMGGKNTAELTDKAVIKILKGYIKRAKKDFGKEGEAGRVLAPLFVMPDGTPFGYNDVVDYFNNRAALTGLKPTDFRKLKSTQVLMENLKAGQEALLARIRGFVGGEVEDLRGRVVEAVQESVERAFAEAQIALSHEDMTTTVEKYINPEVLLRFLSSGQMEGSLEDVILSGNTHLSFNLDAFLEKAGTGKKKSTKKKTTRKKRKG